MLRLQATLFRCQYRTYVLELEVGVKGGEGKKVYFQSSLGINQKGGKQEWEGK